jgi:hypothetical protein
MQQSFQSKQILNTCQKGRKPNLSGKDKFGFNSSQTIENRLSHSFKPI